GAAPGGRYLARRDGILCQGRRLRLPRAASRSGRPAHPHRGAARRDGGALLAGEVLYLRRGCGRRATQSRVIMSHYFEDLAPGQTFEAPARTITEDAAIDFAAEWDPQPFHTDKQAGQSSLFGKLAASGMHTLLLSFRMCVATGAFTPTGLAGLELEK